MAWLGVEFWYHDGLIGYFCRVEIGIGPYPGCRHLHNVRRMWYHDGHADIDTGQLSRYLKLEQDIMRHNIWQKEHRKMQ